MPQIKVKGTIVSDDDAWIYDWFEIEHTSPNGINEALKEAGEGEVEVIINSGGGDVYAGSEIYTALKSHKGAVTVKIVGIAASAASVIAMAGDKVQISPTAQIMIHNTASIAWGDYRDMKHESEVLKNYNKSIANSYRLKSGLSEDELLAMMDKETWLNAQQALEKKFVDEIMFDETMKLVAANGVAQMIPQAVINKMRAERKTQSGEQRSQVAPLSLYEKLLNKRESVVK